MASPDGNLEAKAQAMQLRMGVVTIGVALVAAVVLERLGAGAFARGFVFIPLFMGAYGVQAGLYKTCGFCAIASRRITDEGSEPVANPREASALRRVGMRVIASSAAIAAFGAGLLVMAR